MYVNPCVTVILQDRILLSVQARYLKPLVSVILQDRILMSVQASYFKPFVTVILQDRILMSIQASYLKPFVTVILQDTIQWNPLTSNSDYRDFRILATFCLAQNHFLFNPCKFARIIEILLKEIFG